MKKSIISMIAFLILLFSVSSCMAFQSTKAAVIGGIRDGAAIGLMLETYITDTTKLKFGLEANTSDTPGIIYVGGKWFLTDINNRFPMFFSVGGVGYLGNNSTIGPYVSLILERLFGVVPLFFELGVDVVKTGRLQFQAGYFF